MNSMTAAHSESSRLQGPVVSIGNLTVGGSGKTPFLIMLGELLKERALTSMFFRVAIGGRARASSSSIRRVLPRDFGDEPLLIARKLEVPVIVGEDRYAAGQLAEEKFGAELHLLDDGFQHRRLARDFDIVLVYSQRCAGFAAALRTAARAAVLVGTRRRSRAHR